jgi:hypothetical protein
MRTPQLRVLAAAAVLGAALLLSACGGDGAAALPTYTVTYDANGADSGLAPADGGAYRSGASVTVLGNSGELVKASRYFGGWDTAADGSGSAYVKGSTLTMGDADLVLYATWSTSPVEVTLTVSLADITQYTLALSGTPSYIGTSYGTVTFAADDGTNVAPTAHLWTIDPKVSLTGASSSSVSFASSGLTAGTRYTVTLMEKIDGHWYSTDFGFTAANGSALQ